MCKSNTIDTKLCPPRKLILVTSLQMKMLPRDSTVVFGSCPQTHMKRKLDLHDGRAIPRALDEKKRRVMVNGQEFAWVTCHQEFCLQMNEK